MQKLDPVAQAKTLKAQLADCAASVAMLQAQIEAAVKDTDFELAGKLKPQARAEEERQAKLQKELDEVIAKLPPVRAAYATRSRIP